MTRKETAETLRKEAYRCYRERNLETANRLYALADKYDPPST